MSGQEVKEGLKDPKEEECPFCKGEKCGLTNPPYICDEGCGKVVGCGVDHECERVCHECKVEKAKVGYCD